MKREQIEKHVIEELRKPGQDIKEFPEIVEHSQGVMHITRALTELFEHPEISKLSLEAKKQIIIHTVTCLSGGSLMAARFMNAGNTVKLNPAGEALVNAARETFRKGKRMKHD